MRSLRIALAQINCTVGDLENNIRKIIGLIERSRELTVDIVCFPEMAVTGYPPEDLLLRPSFVKDNIESLRRIIEVTHGISAIVGFVDSEDDIYNAAAFVYDGRLAGIYRKIYLPNYGVFDEDRYFGTGSEYPVFVINGVTVGVNICEDIWYPGGPTMIQALLGDAELIVNINSSPYHVGKCELRRKMLSTRAADNSVIIAYNNMVGGQDELVFDGGSMIFDQTGSMIVAAKQFEEDLVVTDIDIDAVFRQRLHDPRRRKEKVAASNLGKQVKKIVISEKRPNRPLCALPTLQIETPHPVGEIYNALVLGTRDYLRKNGFAKALIGLSGGIDSALTACIAVDAIGKENVIGTFMPSQYTSVESGEDVELLVKKLGIRLIIVPIKEIFGEYIRVLAPEFSGLRADVTEENIQSRIRGNILMALSNKFGWLVLTTGNKSEMSVGYATIYGDMAGGFAVIKDVPKTLVYKLAWYRNSLASTSGVIPQRVLEKEPSAELRPNQKDSDSLPPYPVLDPILQAYVEQDKTLDEIVAMGYDVETVAKVMRMVDGSEYKRRQAPPGIKITPRALGKDRREPITNKYRGF